MSITITFAFYFINYVSSSQVDHSYLSQKFYFIGPASVTSYKIGVVGDNWLVGWLVGW